MMEMIALDCHKHYSVASVQTRDGRCLAERRLEHRPGVIQEFLRPYTAGLLVEQLNQIEETIQTIEKRMAAVFKPTPQIVLLDTLPGVALILAVVIHLEIESGLAEVMRQRSARGPDI